jgi:GT2 family glycosyltransferase
MRAEERVSVVVLTHNRPVELERTLRMLLQLQERPRIIVVDNGSSDGTGNLVRERFPELELVRCDANCGAAGRNAGVARVRTPCVAFCDDDTWWAPGSLARAADVLDACPRVGVVAARVLVGPHEREDLTCEVMARSPLGAAGLPGPALIAFMAGAAVMRVQAYRDVGGYEPRLFIGAEESLMGLDLAARGWQMVYVREVVTHHHPSPSRNVAGRRVMLGRNRMWIAWLRLPARDAWRETLDALRGLHVHGVLWRALPGALAGLPWVLAHRRIVPDRVARMHRLVAVGLAQREHEPRAPAWRERS